MDDQNEIKFKVSIDASDLPQEEKKVTDSFNKMGKSLENQVGKFGSFRSAISQVFNSSLIEKYTRGFSHHFGLVGSILHNVIGRMYNTGSAASALSTKLTQTASAAAQAGSSVASAAVSTAALGARAAASLGPIALVAATVLALVTAAVLVTGGFFKASLSAAEYGAQIFKAAQKTRYSTETLSAIHLVAEEVHLSFEQLVRGMTRFEVNISRALTKPSTEAGLAMRTLGRDAKQLAEDAKNPQKAFFEIMKTMEEMKNVTTRDRVALALFGRDFQSLIPAMEQMGTGFDAMYEKAKRFGLLLSKEETKNLRDLNVLWTDLGRQFQGIFVRIGSQFAPIAIKALTAVSNILEMMMPTILKVTNFLGNMFLVNLQWAEQFIAALSTVPEILKSIASVASVVADSFADIGKTAGHAFLAMTRGFSGDLEGAYEEGSKAYDAGSRVKEKIASALAQSSLDIKAKYDRTLAEIRKPGIMSEFSDPSDDNGPFAQANKRARHQLSEYEKLVKKYKELTAEILSFLDTKSREFSLRIKVEDLERFKKDLESIVTLRRDLGLRLDDALPRNGEAARQLKEQLESYKRVFEAVRDVRNESQKAAEEWATAILTQSIPVLDEETRYQLGYIKALRDRANAEEQLTADVRLQSKLREDAIKNEASEQLKAYNEMRLDAIKGAEQARVEGLKEQMRLMTRMGQESVFRTQLEVKLADTQKDHMVTAVDEIRANVSKITDALTKGSVTNPAGSDRTFSAGEGLGSTGRLGKPSGRFSSYGFNQNFQSGLEALFAFMESQGLHPTIRSGVRTAEQQRRLFLMGRPTPYDGTNKISGHQLGIAADITFGAGERNRGIAAIAEFVRSNPEFYQAGFVKNRFGKRIDDRGHFGLLRKFIEAAMGDTSGGVSAPPSATSQTPNVSQDERLIIGGRALTGYTLGDLYGATARSAALRDATKDMNDLYDQQEKLTEAAKVEEEFRKSGLVDIRERLRLDVAIKEQAERRRQEAEQERVTITLLKKDLEDMRNGDPASVARVQRAAEQAHLLAQIESANRIVQLQYEIAHAAEGASDRYQVAWLDAIREVQKADEDAVISQIRNQVRIADQQVLHLDRVRAAVSDHMASQKGITEVYSDAIVGAMDLVGDGISAMFGKLNEGMGAFGNYLAGIEASLLKMVTNRLLMKLVDAILGPSTGGGSIGFPSVGGTVFGGNQGGGIWSLASGVMSGFTNHASSTGNGGDMVSQFINSIFGGGNTISGSGGTTSNPWGTISGSAQQNAGLVGLLRSAIPGVGGTGAAGGLGGMLSGLAPLAPLLGLSLGASFGSGIGGGSGVGGIMGMLGGGLLGGIGGLLGAGVGLTALTGVGAFSSAGALSAFAPLLGAIPFLAPIAGALLLGSYFIGRSATRRKEETIRAGAINDTLAQLDNIKHLIEIHRLDGAEGLQRATSLRADYITQMSQLKDKKTRNIALSEVEKRIDPKIAQIRAAANIALNDNNRDKLLIPEFATGGTVPGPFGAPRLVLAHGGERFLGLNASLPMYQTSSANVTAGANSNTGSQNVLVNVELSLGTDTQNRLFVNGAESPEGYRVTIKNVKTGQEYGDLEI
jgi:hypothetical protein